MALFTSRHPDVELNFVEQEPEEAVQMLRAAELEVALVFEFRDLSQPEFDRLYEGIELRHLIDDPMYLALPREHPAARKSRVRLQDVADDVWIQNDTTGPCGRLHLAACSAAGFEPKIGFQSDDYNVVQGLIAAGVGVSLLPGARAHEPARGHRGALARPQRARRARSRPPRWPAATAHRPRRRCSTSSPRWPTASSCRRGAGR